MSLSVLIPARNEEWLTRTVQDVLEHSASTTDVIVVLDGGWSSPLQAHDRLTVVKLSQSIGQRAATNLAARLSTADYVMKLDGHCAVAPGFDQVLIDAAKTLGPDVTQIPAQKNLHVWDWVCVCGKRTYQGPTSICTCGQTMTKELVWKPRGGTTTTNWRFDATLHFQYWAKQKVAGPIHDVMTSLGACFFMARERFWQLGGLDESHGAWGNFGIEIACKSWLSGGRHVVNTATWFAHFFRVGGIGFPYAISGHEQERAREYSRQLWRANRWPGQVRTLKSLVDQFWPLPGWSEAERAALEPTPLTKGIIYYSDNRLDPEIAVACQQSIAASGLPIVAVTLKPIAWSAAQTIVLDAERGYLTMFRQILAGLEALDTDLAFFAEHDLMYSQDHFAFLPLRRDTIYYNQHVWKVDASTGHALHYRCNQTSGLCADRRLLLDHYRRRVAHVEQHGFSRRLGFEPGKPIRHGGIDDLRVDTWFSTIPNIDIRHRH